ncbi:MAG: tetratricopeptide repeat protein, partial [bacterium]|nr:tetratricopeptide repeat protein [bacterium]
RAANPRPQSSTVSLADLEAPKKAKKAYEKARQQLSRGEAEKAEANLRKAIEIYPSYPSAWSSLGRMLRRQRRTEEAKAAYRKALEADPKSWRSWAGLAEIGYATENWPEVAEASERATHLMPVASTRLWVYNAVANYSLGNFEEAEQSANDALDRGGWYLPKAYHILGLVHAQRHEFDLAAQHLGRYLKIAPGSHDEPLVRKQLAYVEAAHREQTGEQADVVRHPSGMLVRR